MPVYFSHAKERLKNLRKRFFGSGNTGEVFKNMGILASGSGAAKVIGFLTIPLITRIYAPEDFGVLSVFTSAIAILLPVTTLRYSITIPLPKNDGLAFNIFVLGTFLVVSVSVLLSLFFIAFGEDVFGFFNMAEIAPYWWLLILGLLGAAFHELLTNWATRSKAFIVVAKTNIWQSGLSAMAKIGLGLLGLKPLGLLIGDVIRKGGGTLSLLRSFYREFKKNHASVSLKRIRFLFGYYIDLPRYRLPSQLLLVLSIKIPVLYFAFQFGAEPTGQLGLALSVIGVPMGLLGTTTGKAYYAEIARIGKKGKGEILGITKSIVKRLSFFGVVPCVILLLAGPLLFRVVFGNEWEQAGVFSSILSVYLLVQFITSPLVNVFTVFNLQNKFLQINIVRSIIMILVFGTSFFLNLDVYQTLILYTLLLSSHYLFTGYQVYRVLT